MSRQDILRKIRANLGRGALSESEAAPLRARIEKHKPNLVPSRGQIPHKEQVGLFAFLAEMQGASVARIASAAEAPAAIANFLKENNLPQRLALAPDERITALPWDSAPMLEHRTGPSDGTDPVSVTPCFAGVAETGTLVLTSGAETPTTLNFLPETHIVVIDHSQIVGSYEDAWAKLRERGQMPEAMPRTVNLITGPSLTADIEQTMYRGAHGPKRLHILLVGDGEPS